MRDPLEPRESLAAVRDAIERDQAQRQAVIDHRARQRRQQAGDAAATTAPQAQAVAQGGEVIVRRAGEYGPISFPEVTEAEVTEREEQARRGAELSRIAGEAMEALERAVLADPIAQAYVEFIRARHQAGPGHDYPRYVALVDSIVDREASAHRGSPTPVTPRAIGAAAGRRGQK
jgi:hypothetical protein